MASIVANLDTDIAFSRLSEIEPDDIVAHMSDPRVATHMPLLTATWDRAAVSAFIQTKEAYWKRDGLGHWAVLCGEQYVGWGGFQKDGDAWDYGLVLKPEMFGLGPRVTKKALAFAVSDQRIQTVTFLLPPSRKNLRGLDRLGATFVDRVTHQGAEFLKYRLETV